MVEEGTGLFQAVALHGSALNPRYPVQERLALAVSAMEQYQGEVARLQSEVERLQGILKQVQE